MKRQNIINEHNVDREIISRCNAINFQEWLIQNCTLNLRIWTYELDKSKLYKISELYEMFIKRRK